MKKINEIILGCPDNPNSHGRDLFLGGNYLMCFQGGLDKYAILISDGGIIELHFQLFSEVPSLNPSTPEEKKALQLITEYVKKARTYNIDFMAHLPFLVDKRAEALANGSSIENFDGFFNFDFCWLQVPEKYSKNPAKIPAHVAQSKKDKLLNTRESSFIDICRTIDLLDFLKIELLTVHATKPGAFYAPSEFVNFKEKLNKIQSYIHNKKSSVKICIETGGLQPEELISIHKDCGVFINMDVAHFRLDLTADRYKNKTDQVDDFIVKFVRKNISMIKNMHFTQTFENIDAHKGIFEEGVITCNARLITILQEEYLKNNKIYAMVESKPDYKNFEYVNAVLHNEFKKTDQSLKESASVVLVVGMAACGKSTVRSFIEGDADATIISDRVHEVILSSADSLQSGNFTEEVRQIGYNTILHYLNQYIMQGKKIVLDATFDKKKRRQQLYKILDKIKNNNIYIIQVESADKNGKLDNPADSFAGTVIDKRKAEADKLKQKGRPIPFGLRDFDIYRRLINTYEPFSIKEYPRAHYARINTSKNTISLLNQDNMLKILVTKVKEGYNSIGINVKVQILNN